MNSIFLIALFAQVNIGETSCFYVLDEVGHQYYVYEFCIGSKNQYYYKRYSNDKTILCEIDKEGSLWLEEMLSKSDFIDKNSCIKEAERYVYGIDLCLTKSVVVFDSKSICACMDSISNLNKYVNSYPLLIINNIWEYEYCRDFENDKELANLMYYEKLNYFMNIPELFFIKEEIGSHINNEMHQNECINTLYDFNGLYLIKEVEDTLSPEIEILRINFFDLCYEIFDLNKGIKHKCYMDNRIKNIIDSKLEFIFSHRDIENESLYYIKNIERNVCPSVKLYLYDPQIKEILAFFQTDSYNEGIGSYLLNDLFNILTHSYFCKKELMSIEDKIILDGIKKDINAGTVIR